MHRMRAPRSFAQNSHAHTTRWAAPPPFYGMLFERTASAKKPEATICQDLARLPPRETLHAKLHQSIAIARQKLQSDAEK